MGEPRRTKADPKWCDASIVVKLCLRTRRLPASRCETLSMALLGETSKTITHTTRSTSHFPRSTSSCTTRCRVRSTARLCELAQELAELVSRETGTRGIPQNSVTTLTQSRLSLEL